MLTKACYMSYTDTGEGGVLPSSSYIRICRLLGRCFEVLSPYIGYLVWHCGPLIGYRNRLPFFVSGLKKGVNFQSDFP